MKTLNSVALVTLMSYAWLVSAEPVAVGEILASIREVALINRMPLKELVERREYNKACAMLGGYQKALSNLAALTDLSDIEYMSINNLLECVNRRYAQVEREAELRLPARI